MKTETALESLTIPPLPPATGSALPVKLLNALRLLTKETQFEYRTERICQRTFTILASLRETAGDRVRNGMDVEQALKETDAETRRLNAMLRL